MYMHVNVLIYKDKNEGFYRICIKSEKLVTTCLQARVMLLVRLKKNVTKNIYTVENYLALFFFKISLIDQS